MGRLVTGQTILVLLLHFFSHLNLGACAGFALANCDWLGRTIAFYQVFFQQDRVALGKWCIGPQKGRLRTPGMNFFVQCPGLIFLAARWSGPAASASIFSVCLDYILRVCQSLWDSFLYLGKLNWFLYLLLSYFYYPGMFIFRWSSNFVEKVVLNESMSEPYCGTITEPGLPVVLVDDLWISCEKGAIFSSPPGADHGCKMHVAGLLGQRFLNKNWKWRTKPFLPVILWGRKIWQEFFGVPWLKLVGMGLF